MSEKEILYFEILKKEVVKTLQHSHAVDSNIANWKGQEIIYLQDDLSDKVNGRISEKWFYTHIKSNTGKLPRIDMLNMLSEYAGHQNWNDLKGKFQQLNPKKTKPPKTGLILLFLLITIFSGLYLGSTLLNKNNVYKFCFVDADLKTPIKDSPIWIIWMIDSESPMVSRCDSLGCFQFTTKKEKIKFIVRSPYYKPDTVTRIVHNKNIKEEQIQLKTNDYALMIHMFSKSKVKNWRKRRAQINLMIADNAKIYQVYEDGKTEMELFNKKDFINKLTVPLKSLKKIEVIETIYTGDKISILRFTQNKE